MKARRRRWPAPPPGRAGSRPAVSGPRGVHLQRPVGPVGDQQLPGGEGDEEQGDGAGEVEVLGMGEERRLGVELPGDHGDRRRRTGPGSRRWPGGRRGSTLAPRPPAQAEHPAQAVAVQGRIAPLLPRRSSLVRAVAEVVDDALSSSPAPCRKTSSRVVRRGPRRRTAIPVSARASRTRPKGSPASARTTTSRPLHLHDGRRRRRSPRPAVRGRRATSTATRRWPKISVSGPERSTRPPSSITTHWQVRSMSVRTCEETMALIPKPSRRPISSSISSRPSGSSPAVGSSRSTRSGSWTMAWASLARCFMPVENPPMWRKRSSCSPTRPSTSLARCRAARVGRPAELGGVAHEVGGGLVGGQAGALRHVHPTFERTSSWRVATSSAQDFDAPGGGGEDAEQQLEQSGLAGAVGPDQADLPCGDGGGDAVDRHDVAVGEPQPGEGDDRGGVHWAGRLPLNFEP